ncbi:MAG TPA: DUF1614 domain-containing protein [Candidatus Methanofastidiosa archaeon]|nr:DUF1614 domain-containing protein [Candidatus Methanofastidiosa archaeon]
MDERRMMYLPLGNPILFLMLIFIPIFFIMLFINVVQDAFMNLGLPPMAASFFVVLSIVGSLINIPIREYKFTRTVRYDKPNNLFFSWLYPQSHQYQQMSTSTTLSINLGGAVVPLVICLYIFLRYPGYVFPWCLVTIPLAVLVCYRIARIVPNVGIVMPTFVPPLAASTLAMIFVGSGDVVSLAYVTGVLGVLIGADLLNLKKITDTAASTVSIGGAGTFDGIFLTGIVSVFLGKIVSIM